MVAGHVRLSVLGGMICVAGGRNRTSGKRPLLGPSQCQCSRLSRGSRSGLRPPFTILFCLRGAVMTRAWKSLLCLSVLLLMSCGDDGDDSGPDGNPLTECSTEECGPAPGAPNELCFDGSTAGPVCGADDQGQCGWTVVSCPEHPCNLLECDDETHCKLVQVQCVTTPCPPQPECVPNQPVECPDAPPDPRDPCAGDIRCAYGAETCCGVTHDSYVCSCEGGVFTCFATDACLGAPFGCPDDAPCSPEECPGPAPAAPSILCEDGSIAGPACLRGEDRACGWVITSCP